MVFGEVICTPLTKYALFRTVMVISEPAIVVYFAPSFSLGRYPLKSGMIWLRRRFCNSGVVVLVLLPAAANASSLGVKMVTEFESVKVLERFARVSSVWRVDSPVELMVSETDTGMVKKLGS